MSEPYDWRGMLTMPCIPGRELGAANVQFGGVRTVRLVQVLKSDRVRDYSTAWHHPNTPWHVKRDLLLQ